VTGEWGAPGFIESYEGSCGLQVGGSAVESILLVMDKKTIQSLSDAKFELGGSVSVAAGPQGRDVQARTAPGVSILSYSEATGIFAGMVLGGGYLERDIAANQIFYGEDAELNHILFSRDIAMPKDAARLIRILDEYVAQEEGPLLPNKDVVEARP
ncbi:MAG: lipid-binding SYLF domain-containing protein, partial [Chlamydiia bacterium]|nr:lipid-binding SYLF domain-containing protein [Chlamydiia bacterium]